MEPSSLTFQQAQRILGKENCFPDFEAIGVWEMERKIERDMVKYSKEDLERISDNFDCKLIYYCGLSLLTQRKLRTTNISKDMLLSSIDDSDDELIGLEKQIQNFEKQIFLAKQKIELLEELIQDISNRKTRKKIKQALKDIPSTSSSYTDINERFMGPKITNLLEKINLLSDKIKTAKNQKSSKRKEIIENNINVLNLVKDKIILQQKLSLFQKKITEITKKQKTQKTKILKNKLEKIKNNSAPFFSSHDWYLDPKIKWKLIPAGYYLINFTQKASRVNFSEQKSLILNGWERMPISLFSEISITHKVVYGKWFTEKIHWGPERYRGRYQITVSCANKRDDDIHLGYYPENFQKTALDLNCFVYKKWEV